MKNILFTLALLVSFSSFGQTAEEYFYRAYNKYKNVDYYGAISDYTKAIELNPDAPFNHLSYHQRGMAKLVLRDYYGAISDFTKAIELNPNDNLSYYSRGLAKAMLKNYYGACEDAKKSERLGDSNASELIEMVCN